MSDSSCRQTLSELKDDELKAVVVEHILALERAGASLPDGWRYETLSFSFLDELQASCIAQVNDFELRKTAIREAVQSENVSFFQRIIGNLHRAIIKKR